MAAKQRQLGEFLPVEVWRSFLEYASYRDQINFSTACRLFREICLPFIFKSIVYTSKSSQDSNLSWVEAMEERSVKFQELVSNLSIASCVRQCRLAVSFTGTQKEWDRQIEEDKISKPALAYKAFSEGFLLALPKLPNLQDVTIQLLYGSVDPRLLTILAEMRCLQRLLFHAVSFKGTALQTINNPIPRLKPRELEIAAYGAAADITVDDELPYFSSERLERLSIRSLWIAPRILLDLSKRDICHRLVSLEVELANKDRPILYTILSRCPQLQRLEVELPSYTESAFPPIPQSSVPLLSAYIGPAAFATAIIPGHPVRSAEISSDSGWDRGEHHDVTRAIILWGQSSGPLVDVVLPTIPCHPDLVSAIGEHFRGLHTLRLILRNHDDFEEEDDMGADDENESDDGDNEHDMEDFVIPTDDNGDSQSSALGYKVCTNSMQLSN